jgi:hypothetical protein
MRLILLVKLSQVISINCSVHLASFNRNSFMIWRCWSHSLSSLWKWHVIKFCDPYNRWGIQGCGHLNFLILIIFINLKFYEKIKINNLTVSCPWIDATIECRNIYMNSNPRWILNFSLRYSHAGGIGCFGYFPSYANIDRMKSADDTKTASIASMWTRNIFPYFLCISSTVRCNL